MTHVSFFVFGRCHDCNLNQCLYLGASFLLSRFKLVRGIKRNQRGNSLFSHNLVSINMYFSRYIYHIPLAFRNSLQLFHIKVVRILFNFLSYFISLPCDQNVRLSVCATVAISHGITINMCASPCSIRRRYFFCESKRGRYKQ